MSLTVGGAQALLTSSSRLDRDKGVVYLKDLIVSEPGGGLDISISLLNELETFTSETTWEPIHGVIAGLHLTIKTINQGLHPILMPLITKALGYVDYPEYRVREATGHCIGAAVHAAKGTPQCAEILKVVIEHLVALVKRDLKRDINLLMTPEAQLLQVKLGLRLEEAEASSGEHQATAAGNSVHDEIKGSGLGIFHDTAGWKSLATSMKCFLWVVEGAGVEFAPFVSETLINEVFNETVRHTNRFVREGSFHALGAVICQMDESSLLPLSGTVSKVIAKGLQDNWSQVRLASSIAVRSLILKLSCEEREKLYDLLVPRMCLNRYYVAAGVRIYSQTTWKEVFGDNGKGIVERHIEATIAYYSMQTQADNHAVREAACSCLAEVGAKLNPLVAKPYVLVILERLTECFKDASWPVRQAACVALGRFIHCCPAGSRGVYEDSLRSVFVTHLSDNVWSVREDSAISLGQILEVYQEEWRVLKDIIIEGLKAMENQKSDSTKNAKLSNVTQFGVSEPVPASVGEGEAVARTSVTVIREGDEAGKGENNQMYSCGSLAPKLKRGCGCMDHGFTRATQPWETSDGMVYMLRESSRLFPLDVAELLPLLANCTRKRHYSHHVYLLETVWKNLPIIAKNVGKKPFKRHLEIFLEPLVYTLTCGNNLASAAAASCIQGLKDLIGDQVFRARVENADPHLLKKMEAYQSGDVQRQSSQDIRFHPRGLTA